VKNRVSLLALFSFCIIHVSQPARCQESRPAAQQNVQAQPVQTSFTSTKGFVLEDQTPVRLRLNRTISSADAHVGDTVDFEVLDDISVNGTLVIPKGGLAFATVTEAQAKRRMARGGKLDINIDYVKLVSGERAALRAVKDVNGGGHTGGMVGGMVATSLVFFPAAPFFLFMHGKDISIPKGTEITAYVNGDMKLDIAKFQPAINTGTQAGNGIAQGEPPLGPNVHMESVPPGADIEVDGSFVGSTPSDLEIGIGEHMISVKKDGFKDWNRKLKINGASKVHLSAELETIASPSSSMSSGEGNAATLTSPPQGGVNPVPTSSLNNVHDDSANGSPHSTIGASTDGNPDVRHDGITLAAVTPGGPADQAGLKAGDVILAINDHYLFTIRELQEEIGHHQPGTRLTVRYRRYSAINEATIVVGMVQ
jgi:hypothetical protein